MALSTRCAVVLSIVLLIAFTSAVQSAAFDPKALDQKINLDLRDTSMANAIAMVANAADVQVVAPGEPDKGIIMALHDRTVRDVLDALSAATGMKWSVQNDMIVFTNPPEPPADQRKPAKDAESLSPEQAMSELIASLDARQFYAVSGGYPMGYADLSSYQQDILKGMLSAPTVAVTRAGDIEADLPSAQDVSILFATMPYLTVPNPEGKGTMTIRLDSTDYLYLKRGAK